jgi:hypothetical protein
MSRVIKLGVAATALLLIPRRSSPRADKVVTKSPKNLSAKNTLKQPINKNTEQDNHN